MKICLARTKLRERAQGSSECDSPTASARFALDVVRSLKMFSTRFSWYAHPMGFGLNRKACLTRAFVLLSTSSPSGNALCHLPARSLIDCLWVRPWLGTPHRFWQVLNTVEGDRTLEACNTYAIQPTEICAPLHSSCLSLMPSVSMTVGNKGLPTSDHPSHTDANVYSAWSEPSITRTAKPPRQHHVTPDSAIAPLRLVEWVHSLVGPTSASHDQVLIVAGISRHFVVQHQLVMCSALCHFSSDKGVATFTAGPRRLAR